MGHPETAWFLFWDFLNPPPRGFWMLPYVNVDKHQGGLPQPYINLGVSLCLLAFIS